MKIAQFQRNEKRTAAVAAAMVMAAKRVDDRLTNVDYSTPLATG
jgi:hypothetical protein